MFKIRSIVFIAAVCLALFLSTVTATAALADGSAPPEAPGEEVVVDDTGGGTGAEVVVDDTGGGTGAEAPPAEPQPADEQPGAEEPGDLPAEEPGDLPAEEPA
ncbi:MAG: hypothetical protein JXB85_15835, partial [Anaerolineales bacterium]|nr:hypothetical protein [Anaerolineales bacterium]